MAYGLPGTPTNQHTREYGDITVSSITWANPAGSVGSPTTKDALGEPSGLTGVAGSYYKIWGYSVVTNVGTACFGYLEDEDAAENIAPYGITNAGPMMHTFNVPIKLAPDKGTRIRSFGGTGSGYLLASFHYTVHTP